MKAKAVLFGINYFRTPSARLNGCVNDVQNMSAFLKGELGIPCDVYTDDSTPDDTTGMGMLRRLYEAAVASWRDDLDLVWIHYSGHGTSIRDTSGDELDGKDECLVPSDFKTGGLIKDDAINALCSQFNPKTRVICVFDCCHSGTIGDVKYSWEGPNKVSIENILCAASCRVITISGCLDTQVSMDAYNIDNSKKFAGAMTTCLLAVLRDPAKRGDVFKIIDELQKRLKDGGFEQVPKVCSSHNLAKDPTFILAACT